ncbi:hypothetical protein [Mycolicibacterium baixiangningiae]|uniref:hypothetical protein n=1 Tax=Mycolicibacterium baixiangningiae TaxID=2761578 RepID=UPI001E3CECBD|nr:hypothetical protein [Mycolicibacterium baixiangningiae]
MRDIEHRRLVHRHLPRHGLSETVTGQIRDFTADEIARIALIVGSDLAGACRDRDQVGRIVQTDKGCSRRIRAQGRESQPADQRADTETDEGADKKFDPR